MTRKKLIFDGDFLNLTIDRLCHEVIENHDGFEDTAIIGLQSCGVYLASRFRDRLIEFVGVDLPFGSLDVTFFRDDFRRREEPLNANTTQIDFTVEGKKIIIIDDVLYTGRTFRSALTAMSAFGRAKKVELLVMIDRCDSRELPIQANYVGHEVTALDSQKIVLELVEQGSKKDKIWLVNQ